MKFIAGLSSIACACFLLLGVGYSQTNSAQSKPVAQAEEKSAENKSDKKAKKKASSKKKTESSKETVKTKKSNSPTAANKSTSSKAGRSEWPCFLGPNGNGVSDEKGLARTFPADGPKILWKASLGTGYSGISVSGGRVFTLYGKEGRERIVCFAVETGDQLWEIDADADYAEGRSHGPRATPCVDGERVYTVGASGKVFCLEVATGKEIWSLNVYQDYSFQPHAEGLAPSPLIDGEKLILLAGTKALALDKMTGKTMWTSLDENMNHVSPTIATIGGTRQLLVLSGSNLVGLSLDSGTELWRHPSAGVNNSNPVVGPGDQIFTGAAYGFGSQLIKVAGGRAEEVYKNSVLASHHATPILHDGYLYGFHDRVGIMKCVDFAGGEEKWESRSPGKGKMIMADGQFILLTEEGELVLAPVSPEGFHPTASARLLKGTCYTAPSLAGGKLYIRSDQELACIDLKN